MILKILQFYLKKRDGFADGGLLVQMLIYCMIAGVITTSLVTLQSSQYSALTTGRIELEAQQWADIRANVVRAIGFDEIQSQPRKPIDGSNFVWEDEVIVGAEQVIAPDHKQKIVTVKIYKSGDNVEKFALKVPLSSQGSSSVPVGTVIAWPLSSDPTGAEKGKWLECNGQPVDPTKYPKLAALMNTTPNYAGVFLRGFGSQNSNHYGSVLHQSANLGELQGDTIRNITGSFMADTNSAYFSNGAFFYNHTGLNGDNGGYADEIALYSFDASRVVPTAEENRPINKAVRWLIKAR